MCGQAEDQPVTKTSRTPNCDCGDNRQFGDEAGKYAGHTPTDTPQDDEGTVSWRNGTVFGAASG